MLWKFGAGKKIAHVFVIESTLFGLKPETMDKANGWKLKPKLLLNKAWSAKLRSFIKKQYDFEENNKTLIFGESTSKPSKIHTAILIL